MVCNTSTDDEEKRKGKKKRCSYAVLEIFDRRAGLGA
jgi:hypothetical protein